LGSEQAYLLLNDWAVARPAKSRSNSMSDMNLRSMHLRDFIKYPNKLTFGSRCDQRIAGCVSWQKPIFATVSS
jgi:hypothetical protein